jgi:hypothetical protein
MWLPNKSQKKFSNPELICWKHKNARRLIFLVTTTTHDHAVELKFDILLCTTTGCRHRHLATRTLGSAGRQRRRVEPPTSATAYGQRTSASTCHRLPIHDVDHLATSRSARQSFRSTLDHAARQVTYNRRLHQPRCRHHRTSCLDWSEVLKTL